jgi:hypothetical protein
MSQLYSIENQEIEHKSDMINRHQDHAMVFDPAYNRIYVFGGAYPGTSLKCERYSLTKNAWSQLPDAPQRLTSASATLLNGKIYIVEELSSDLIVYSRQYNNFRVIRAMMETKASLTKSIFAKRGKLYVMMSKQTYIFND